jgi:molecular chaperone HscA
VADPENTIVSVKRFMGRGLADAQRHSSPYRFVDAPGMVRIQTRAGDKSPVEVSAEILKTLYRRAEASLGGDIVGAVITVPAYFDDAQRQATKDAARLAGIEVMRLLNEPTAAAIAYGLDNRAEGRFVIFDLGGGTFDVSILNLSRGVFEVVATGGDTVLGGDDFDRCVIAWALREAGLADAECEDAIAQALDRKLLSPGDLRALFVEARRAKEALSEQDSTTFALRLSDASLVRLPLTRDRFQAMSAFLVKRCLNTVNQVLRDAHLSVSDIDAVVLVGGATRMPAIRSSVAGLFGRDPLVDLDPDSVVAMGAAMQANLLAGNRAAGDDWLLLDVIPLSLGLETMGGLVEKIIARNATIPVARAQDFTTFRDGQTAIAIHVVQGERELVADCRSLARFELRNIPPMAAGAARVRVSFQVDADGLLSVTACEQTSGVKASISVRPSYGLSDDEIATMLQSAFASAADDVKARALREQQIEADRLLEATRSALQADGDLLTPAEHAQLSALLAQVSDAREGTGTERIRHAIEALSLGTEAFAARRMDRSIAKALAGRRVDELGST